MNYIDRIAIDIYNAGWDAALVRPVTSPDEMDDDDLALSRIYAVLALAKGEDVTNEDVHDAWSAWRAASFPDHRSIVPFEALHRTVQELDTPYMEAIRRVARSLKATV